MTDEERLREAYRRASAARPHVPISPEQLDALAAGRLRGDAALALLDRVMADPVARREFELLRAVHEAGRPPASRVSFRWMGLAAAAALLIAVPLLRPGRGADAPAGDAPVVRGGAAAVALLAPDSAAMVDAPVEFRWRPVAGALRYRLEVIEADGSVAFERELPDTVLALAPDALPAGMALQWRVEAVTPEGVRRSLTSRFTLRRP